jgi:hypothetical protein
MAVAMTYYFRLDPKHNTGSRFRYLRDEFARMVQDLIERHSNIYAASREAARVDFKDVLRRSLDRVFAATILPRGIAATQGLKENVYANVACIECGIPLVITGDPGTGKTLSFRIASDNMKGHSSTSSPYQRLHAVQRFGYQCSEATTSAEITSVYAAAQDRHHRFERVGIRSERCVVLLDEGNLPSEKRAALKAIHYVTDQTRGSAEDRPPVVTVMITNMVLDSAKTNRFVQLLQREMSPTDLKELAKGCLLEDRAPLMDAALGRGLSTHAAESAASALGVRPPNPQEAQQVDKLIDGLCSGFQHVNDYSDFVGQPKAFHARDFVYLLRLLRQDMDTAYTAATGMGSDFLDPLRGRFTAEQLLSCLRRSFNGISASRFAELAKKFLTETKLELPALDDGQLGPTDSSDPRLSPQVINTLRASIAARPAPGSDPSHDANRHIMLLDKTESESAISLLFELGLLNRRTTHICAVSDFPEDATDLRRSELVARVKTAAESGATVLLIGSGPIQSSFYDLFNKHYSSVAVRAAASSNDDGTTGGRKHSLQYYANVAVGSFSRCVRSAH